MSRSVLVRTTYVYPPIPIREMDWQATLDGYEPGDPIGTGPTEADAVYALFLEIEMREDAEKDAEDAAQEEWQAPR